MVSMAVRSMAGWGVVTPKPISHPAIECIVRPSLVAINRTSVPKAQFVLTWPVWCNYPVIITIASHWASV